MLHIYYRALRCLEHEKKWEINQNSRLFPVSGRWGFDTFANVLPHHMGFVPDPTVTMTMLKRFSTVTVAVPVHVSFRYIKSYTARCTCYALVAYCCTICPSPFERGGMWRGQTSAAAAAAP